MSQAQKIRDYIAKRQPNEDGFIPLDLDEMGKALGSTRAKVGSHLAAMAAVGKLTVVHAEKSPPGGGRKPVIGIRPIALGDRRSPKNRKPQHAKQTPSVAAAQPEPRVIRRFVQTPELDRVAEARDAMSEFVRQFPGMVDEARATEAIRIDESKAEVYVNEGLSLIQRNVYLEQQNRDLRDRNRELERELGYKRLANNKELRAGLASAGVTHGD